MKTQDLKNLIKEAVREVLKEELANIGKQKIQESLAATEEWPTVNLTTKKERHKPNQLHQLKNKMFTKTCWLKLLQK